MSLSCVLERSLRRVRVVGKEWNGKGFGLCVGHTGMISSSRSGKMWYTAGVGLPGLCTALACAFPQPSRESKLHKILKGLFIFSFQRSFFFKIVLLFKVKNVINLANSCNLPCNSGDTRGIPAPRVKWSPP